MKKLICLLLVAAMLLCCVACGAKEESNEPQDSASESGTNEAGTTDGEAIKVGLISGLTGFGDLSMNDQAMEGCKRAEEDFGIELKTVEPKDTTQVLDMIQSFADDGYQIIICAVPDYDDILADVAPQYPDVNFLTIDSTFTLDNVMAVEYMTHEGSYLAGAAAAMKSETGVIGAVGGMDLVTISRFIDAYEQGAKAVNPDIECIVKYVGTDYNAWADTATAKSLTLDMIDNGADVVFQIAGGAGLGTIEACGERGVYAIGVNVDQEYIAPDTVMTSMLTAGENAIYEAIESYVKEGKKFTGIFTADLSNSCVDIVYSKHLTEEETKQLQDMRQQIIDGEIDVVDAVNP